MIDVEELRASVQMLHDGADREYKRMLHADGSESMYAPEHRHFRDAYRSVLDLMEDSE